jgi:small subunit ribosomal protein S18
MSDNKQPIVAEETQYLRVVDRSHKQVFFKKRKGCPLHTDGVNITWKDPDFLKKFTSEGGRILGARITGVCSKHQREITAAIKQARMIALLPFVAKFD